MAAANASPPYRGRTTGQAHHISQPQVAAGGGYNASSSKVGHRTTGNDRRYLPGDSGMEGFTDYDEMYLPDAGKRGSNGLGSEHRKKPQEGAANVLAAKALPSSGMDHEMEHLRTQARSIGVLQELLADGRAEIQVLHQVIDALEATLHQHGLQAGHSLQERLSCLRLASCNVPESEWSVELKRPPVSRSMDQSDGREQVAELTRRLREKEEVLASRDEEVSDLRGLLRASEDAKEREIARLQDRLRSGSEDRQTSDAICQSLSGETEVLKTRIQRLVLECQGLAQELSSWKRNKIPDRGQPAAMNDTPVSAEDQLRVARQQVQQLDREKGQLSDQLKEVIRMNKRWQKFNRQEDRVKQELTQTKAELENQNKALELRCRDYEDSADKLRAQLQELETQRRHQRVSHTLAAGREDTVRRLEKRAIDLEQELARARRESAKYDKEMVKQQLKQYTEDFQKEHTEKEKLKRENTILMRNHLEAEELVVELSRKLDEAEKENKNLRHKQHRMNAALMYPDMNMTRERRELTPHGAPHNGSVVSLENFPTLPRDVQPDGLLRAPLSSSLSPPISPPPMPVGEDCVDGTRPSPRPSPSPSPGSSPSPYRDAEPLQCPRCLREFPVSKHSDFMRHTESCLDT